MAMRRVSLAADAEPAAEVHPERTSDSRTRTIGRGQMAATARIRELKSPIPTTGARSVPDRDPPEGTTNGRPGCNEVPTSGIDLPDTAPVARSSGNARPAGSGTSLAR